MATYARTIQELTSGRYSELAYTILSPISGAFMSEVNELLGKCDLKTSAGGNTYSLQVHNAVMEFQSKMFLPATGILNNATWQTMLTYASKYSDIINGVAIDLETEEIVAEKYPHFSPFFDEANVKTHRRNGKDIKIVFGNNKITKTLKNVYMRSVSVEVDTSGNPIAEVYEFIAQDVTESDEFLDAKKYTVPESPLDVKIKYSFERVLN